MWFVIRDNDSLGFKVLCNVTIYSFVNNLYLMIVLLGVSCYCEEKLSLLFSNIGNNNIYTTLAVACDIFCVPKNITLFCLVG